MLQSNSRYSKKDYIRMFNKAYWKSFLGAGFTSFFLVSLVLISIRFFIKGIPSTPSLLLPLFFLCGLVASISWPFISAVIVYRRDSEDQKNLSITLDEGGLREVHRSGVDVFLPWNEIRSMKVGRSDITLGFRNRTAGYFPRHFFSEEMVGFIRSKLESRYVRGTD